ncbi:hypothetical protein EB412_23410 [Escherichia coli]|nr:hypothetical protein [Escherichia coli]
METDRVTGGYQVRIHVALPLLLCTLPLLVRSCLSWHYPKFRICFSPAGAQRPGNTRCSGVPS